MGFLIEAFALDLPEAGVEGLGDGEGIDGGVPEGVSFSPSLLASKQQILPLRLRSGSG
jgi:hypothetical protein